MPDTVDQKYYEAVPSRGIAERLLVAARDRIYEDFLLRMRPGPVDSILDVGVSDVLNDGANVLERRYDHKERIVACGIGTAVAFQQEFPTVRYVQIEPNRPLPFDDRHFDIATANAVLEHVGSRQNQKVFVAELCRVAKRVFISVPHRYFPVEHHTAVPFLHYWDRPFRFVCSLIGKQDWTREENLILMTVRRLEECVPPGKRAVIGRTGLRLGAMSSNLFLSIE
ncbi:MAG: class I SAM-dependent methyltransferase [Microvirga sp.]